VNRYVIEGLAADLRAGKHIGLMSVTRNVSRHTFTDLAVTVGAGSAEVRRANGQERITHASGGTLTVLTAKADSLRGLLLNVLVIADWEHIDMGAAADIMDAARHMTRARGDLEVVRL
jgi:hypothetical protein